MAELAVRADLPIEAPAVTLQGTDDISNFHRPRVRERCDDLVERSTSQRYVQGSRRGTVRRGNSLVIGSAPPASQNANLEPLVEGPAISLAARHTKVRREGYAK